MFGAMFGPNSVKLCLERTGAAMAAVEETAKNVIVVIRRIAYSHPFGCYLLRTSPGFGLVLVLRVPVVRSALANILA